MLTNGWHPSWEELSAFDSGLLGTRDWETVAAHIAACDACCERLERVPEDPLIALLRRSGYTIGKPAVTQQ
jgi:hypothetical protein